MMIRRISTLAAGALLLAAQPAHAWWRGRVWVDPFPLVYPAYGPYYAYPQAPLIVQQPDVQEASPELPAAPAAPAAWYWCPNAGAYYPYVKECAGGWQTVPVGSVPPTATPGNSAAGATTR
jgi:hypothetical protein